MNISKQTKISDLLEKYPFLIEEMEKISSHFSLLKNKVARAMMAKIATIDMAAKAANLSPEELIGAIKKIVDGHGGDALEIETDEARASRYPQGNHQGNASGGAIRSSPGRSSMSY